MKFLLSSWTWLLTTTVVCELAAAGQSSTPSPPLISGLWVWSADSYRTTEQQARLLKFCHDYHFNHLDVHVQIKERQAQAVLTDEIALAGFLARAAKSNVSVCALRGSPRMFFEKNRDRTLRELEAIIRFNAGLPADARFKGVKYDVEPQTLDEWHQAGAAREKIMRDYLQVLGRLKEALDHARTAGIRMELAVDIPFWWDKEELRIAYNGQTRRFSEQVQDLTDSVTLMSYRRDPEQVKQLVKTEKEYAARTGKLVMAGLLQSPARNPAEASLSFHDLPIADYVRVRRELETWAAGQPGMGGVMHHDYASLRQSLDGLDPQGQSPKSKVVEPRMNANEHE
jgi:hypothetical protein